MSRLPRTVVFALVAAATAWTLVGCRRAPVVSPPAVDAETGAAPTDADAADADAITKDADAPAPLRDLRVQPPPETRSAAPTEDEWTHAERVSFFYSCSAHVVREWIRLTDCGEDSSLLIGGDATEVTLPNAADDSASHTITFPIRRGDRRVFQLHTGMQTNGYDQEPNPASMETISEAWLADEKAPILTVTRTTM